MGNSFSYTYGDSRNDLWKVYRKKIYQIPGDKEDEWIRTEYQEPVYDLNMKRIIENYHLPLWLLHQ